MSVAKIAVSLDQQVVHQLDGLVRKGLFPSRSRAIQEALQNELSRLDRSRLAVECAKLDPKHERELAEEGMSIEVEQWPEYEGEIHWADSNPTKGKEQSGLRPVLILSQDVFNEHSGTVIAVAITSQSPKRAFR